MRVHLLANYEWENRKTRLNNLDLYILQLHMYLQDQPWMKFT